MELSKEEKQAVPAIVLARLEPISSTTLSTFLYFFLIFRCCFSFFLIELLCLSQWVDFLTLLLLIMITCFSLPSGSRPIISPFFLKFIISLFFLSFLFNFDNDLTHFVFLFSGVFWLCKSLLMVLALKNGSSASLLTNKNLNYNIISLEESSYCS